MPEPKSMGPLLVAQIVRSYVAHNGIPSGELPNLIATVHRSLAGLGKPTAAPPPTAAVAINRSYNRNFLSVSTAAGAARCSAATSPPHTTYRRPTTAPAGI